VGAPFRDLEKSRRDRPGCRTVRTRIQPLGSDMAQGTVKRFNGEKGYGFIAPQATHVRAA
jgi:hypothetical protein